MSFDETRSESPELAQENVARVVVHAMFPDPAVAIRATAALLDHGISPRDVSVMVSKLPNLGQEAYVDEQIVAQASQGITVTTAQDAAKGAVKGAGIGIGLGTLAAAAALTIPGVGIVLGGGALAVGLGAMLASGAAGALTGAVYGYLCDQGVDEQFALAVQEQVALGGALVSVTLPSGEVTVEMARTILAKYQDQWFWDDASEVAMARRRESHEVPDPAIEPILQPLMPQPHPFAI